MLPSIPARTLNPIRSCRGIPRDSVFSENALAVAAMKADRDIHLMALIIQDIIKDAIERTGGKRRGRRSPAALGFLAEISEVIAAGP
jgi:hypothetical protein